MEKLDSFQEIMSNLVYKQVTTMTTTMTLALKVSHFKNASKLDLVCLSLFKIKFKKFQIQMLCLLVKVKQKSNR